METGPVKSTLDNVVDKLQQMNKDQTAIQKEAMIYSNELQDYVQNEGHAMSNAQLVSMQELILALREGRLDDIEATKEELIRQRAEERRDEERNDTLNDTFKQLKKQYKLLQNQFKDKDGITILGLIIRTAVVGLLIGAVQGVASVYANAFKKIGLFLGGTSKKIMQFFQLDKLFASIKLGFGNLKAGFKDLFKNSKFAQFFKGGNKNSFMGLVFKEFMNIWKDVSALLKNQIQNVVKVFKAVGGFFTGAPLAFKGLTDLKFGISSNSKFFTAIGNFLNFVKGPFVSAFTAIGSRIKDVTASLTLFIGKTFDKIASVFTGKDGTLFQKMGQNVVEFFKRSGPLARFFGFFSAIQGAFIQLGKVIGSKLLLPIFALIGSVMAIFEDTRGVTDGVEKYLRGLVALSRGAFRMIVGEFLDFVKQAVGFIIDLIPGVDGVREYFGKFSFADFFDNLFFMVADFYVEIVNQIRDTIADIGIGGMLKNIGLELAMIFGRIVDFPIAVAKGAMAAIKNAFSGPAAAKKAFADTFNEQMSSGVTSYLQNKMTVADGLDSKGEDLEYRSDAFKDGTHMYQQGKSLNPAGSVFSQTTNEYAQSIMVNNDSLSAEHMNFINEKIFNQFKD